jgi:copper transport protein
MHPTLLLQAPDESLSAVGVVLEYIGFLAYFLMFGALGFRLFVLGRMPLATHATASVDMDGGEHSVADVAAYRAAWMGVIGTLLFLGGLLHGLAGQAAQKQISMSAALAAGGGRSLTPVIAGLALLIGFLIALGRTRAGWALAAIGGLVLALRSITTLKWTTLVNPLHEVAASLWLGTLLVLLVAGFPAVLRSALPTDRRGALIAAFIGRFSPVALWAAALLGITGVITAWRHLKYVAALWTTPYGYALDVKLVLVAIVVALGAWNWRRVSPRLGSEGAAQEMRRSATTELTFAAIVLAVTAVLVSLPAPRLPHP